MKKAKITKNRTLGFIGVPVSLLVKSAVAAVDAQVLPLAKNNDQNATGTASPGSSGQQQNVNMTDNCPLNGNLECQEREK